MRLGLFDFPNPNRTSPQRFGTNTPLARACFFLNSDMLMSQAEALDERLESDVGTNVDARIRHGYRLVFGRVPTGKELALTRRFVTNSDDGWPRLAQTWLISNEFLYVN